MNLSALAIFFLLAVILASVFALSFKAPPFVYIKYGKQVGGLFNLKDLEWKKVPEVGETFKLYEWGHNYTVLSVEKDPERSNLFWIQVN